MPDELEQEGPKQSVRLMPDDTPDVGPYFPSGMNQVEAAVAGATEGMEEAEVAALRGEAPATKKASKDE